MKKLFLVLLFITLKLHADTPPPGTVKAKMYSGNGSIAVAVTPTGEMKTSITGGTVAVTGSIVASNPSVGSTGIAIPAQATLIGGTDSGTFRAAKVTAAGLQAVDGSGVTQPVSGTFWQATQPVSGTVNLTGGTLSLAMGVNSIGTVGVSNFPASQAVTGTFWQATQPVSGTVNLTGGTLSLAGSLPAGVNSIGTVGISNFPATQAITGTVTANAGTGTFTVDGSGFTQPVSGTFWQATQPVSGTVGLTGGTVGISGTVPVSGTFWQATQPVSGTVNLTGGTIGISGTPAVTVTNGTVALTGGTVGISGTVPVSGTFWQATQPVSGNVGITGTPSVTVTNGTVALTGGTVGISGTVPVSGTFWQATQPVSGTVSVTGGTIGVGGTAAVNIVNGTVAITSSATLATAAQDLYFTGPSAQTAVVTNVLPTSGTASIDALGYHSASVQVVSTGSGGTYIFEASNDNVNFNALTVFNGALTTGVPIVAAITATSSSFTYNFPLAHRYFRLRIATTITGGSIQAFTKMSQIPFYPPVTQVANNTGTSLVTNATLLAGSAIAGNFRIDQTTVGTTNGVSVAQVGANTVLTGNGITGTGSLRTTIANASATVKQAAISIGTSAVRLTTDASAPSATRTMLAAQLLTGSTALCYMGSSSVTSSSTGRGIQMFPGQVFSFANDAGDYYAICDTAAQTFFITEQE